MFDYVIVGAGSAGCVLANRLSADPDVKVLLIEAGGSDRHDFVDIPGAWPAQLRTERDWDYSTGYEPFCNERRISLPRGKMLGGSSSLNTMVYMRGNALDYDEWRDLGCAGWSHTDVLPYFKRAEDNERGASEYHGAGGPLRVSDGRSESEIQQMWLYTALARGIPANEDFNGAAQEGVGWLQFTTRDGRRGSTAAGYLHPVASSRPNLSVETYVTVLKILFDGTTARGVQGTRLGEVLEFRAAREVIVCAGAYGSPQLLMLSGIGRPDELAQLQIATVAESPGVGMNLHDHPISGVTYHSDRDDTYFEAFNDENLARWSESGKGPLACSGAEAGGFVRTRDDLPAPDMQLYCMPGMLVNEGTAPPPGPGVGLLASLQKPLSRGFLALVSPDPTAKPLIVHNYFQEPEDLRAQVAGIRLCMEVAESEPFAECAREPFHVPASKSDEDIAAYLRARVQTHYHPVGTCKMGVDELAVVDPELRVRGVDGLRVVDASVMPKIPRGNTNAPTIMIAEKAADLILERSAVAEAGRAEVA